MMDRTFADNKSEGLKSPSNLPIIIAQWPRNSRETIQVKLDQYQGRNTIDCRTWYPGADDDLKPGKGITLGIAHLPKLAAAVNDALAKAIALDLVQEGGDQ
jgi:hypothetical protein